MLHACETPAAHDDTDVRRSGPAHVLESHCGPAFGSLEQDGHFVCNVCIGCIPWPLNPFSSHIRSRRPEVTQVHA